MIDNNCIDGAQESTIKKTKENDCFQHECDANECKFNYLAVRFFSCLLQLNYVECTIHNLQFTMFTQFSYNMNYMIKALEVASSPFSTNSLIFSYN